MAGAVSAVVGWLLHTTPAEEVLIASALPCLLVAVGWRVWTAPENGLPDALRLRRLSRRIALRLSTVAAATASVCLPVWLGAGGAAGVIALWSATLAPVPVLLEPLPWLFAPRGLRHAVRAGRILEEAQRLSMRVEQHAELKFDPALGRAGRLVPDRHLPAPGGFGEPCGALPTLRRLRSVRGLHPVSPEDQLWLLTGSLRWSGHTLVFTYAPHTAVKIPLGPYIPSSALGSPLADMPTELVWLYEHHGPAGEVRLLLLDARSRCLLTMSGVGMSEPEVARVAQAAGLSYSAYELRLPVIEWSWNSLPSMMFPRHRRHLQLKLTSRQQRALEQVVELQLPPRRWPEFVGPGKRF